MAALLALGAQRVTVVVYGATGWTGSKVAAALARRGLPVVLSGRSASKLEELRRRLGRAGEEIRVRPAALSDPGSLRGALEGARVVVNCAGPFVEVGLPVLDAALAAGAHYVDVSGEESYVADAYALDARAKEAGVAVCPAFAAKGALGDWGASIAASGPMRARGLDDVAIAYAHGLREYFRPSVASVLSSAGQGFFRGEGWDATRFIVPRRFPFPPPFDRGMALRVPSAEDVSIPRHLTSREVATYIALDPGGRINEPWARASLASLPAMPWISKVLFSDWGRLHLRLYLPKPEVGHRDDSFAVSVEVRAGETTATLGIATYDAYASTAEIVALGVLRLYAGREIPCGALAPAQVCDPRATLAELSRLGAVRVYGWS